MFDFLPQLSESDFRWGEFLRNIGILVAGGIGVWIAWQRSRAATLQAQAALDQSRLARRDHITEIFNRSVGQLGDEKLEVRLGAIYTLRAICEEDAFLAYTWPVVQTLSAYIRGKSTGLVDGEMPEDVAAIAEWLHAKAGRSQVEDEQ